MGRGAARAGEIAVIGLEQIGLLLGRAFGERRIALVQDVSGPDDQKAPIEPGNDEDDALLLVLQSIGVGLRRLGHLQDDMAPAHEP